MKLTFIPPPPLPMKLTILSPPLLPIKVANKHKGSANIPCARDQLAAKGGVCERKVQHSGRGATCAKFVMMLPSTYNPHPASQSWPAAGAGVGVVVTTACFTASIFVVFPPNHDTRIQKQKQIDPACSLLGSVNARPRAGVH
jgi:hypothetical protein